MGGGRVIPRVTGWECPALWEMYFDAHVRRRSAAQSRLWPLSSFPRVSEIGSGKGQGCRPGRGSEVFPEAPAVVYAQSCESVSSSFCCFRPGAGASRHWGMLKGWYPVQGGSRVREVLRQ